jgi:hypothetical protein
LICIGGHELENLLRILQVVFCKKNFLANIFWLTSWGDSFGNISLVTEPIRVCPGTMRAAMAAIQQVLREVRTTGFLPIARLPHRSE